MKKNIKMKRMKFYFLLALSILFSFSACGKDNNELDFEIPPHKTKYEKEEGAIRIMAYNVLRFVHDKNDQYNYQTIANMVNEKDVDAVCVNELDSFTMRSNRDYQLEKFAKALGDWDFKFGTAMPYSGGSYGEGVATREKAVRKFTVGLPKGVGAEPRVLVVMEMEDFVIATTHLDHVSSEAQIDQVKVINEAIEKEYKFSDKPVFLAGDLNAYPDSETIAYLKENWTLLSSTQPTFPSHSPNRCIDYVFQYNNGVKCEVLHTEVIRFLKSGNPATASDHLPVIVDVKILGRD
jgi:endonuclease/exonuclease/phosphatase family metal-dependent hydrolase